MCGGCWQETRGSHMTASQLPRALLIRRVTRSRASEHSRAEVVSVLTALSLCPLHAPPNVVVLTLLPGIR